MSTETALSGIRQELEAERDALRAQLVEIGYGEGLGLEYDPNFADSSQVTAERGETAALGASLQETLSDVERTIAKLDENTFGSCERCGQAIAPARLEAMPTARHCMDCAAKAR